jgi:hypothetical protein
MLAHHMDSAHDLNPYAPPPATLEIRPPLLPARWRFGWAMIWLTLGSFALPFAFALVEAWHLWHGTRNPVMEPSPWLAFILIPAVIAWVLTVIDLCWWRPTPRHRLWLLLLLLVWTAAGVIVYWVSEFQTMRRQR